MRSPRSPRASGSLPSRSHPLAALLSSLRRAAPLRIPPPLWTPPDAQQAVWQSCRRGFTRLLLPPASEMTRHWSGAQTRVNHRGTPPEAESRRHPRGSDQRTEASPLSSPRQQQPGAEPEAGSLNQEPEPGAWSRKPEA